MPKMVSRICVSCQNLFLAEEKGLRRNRGKCCSHSCAAKLASRNRNQSGPANNNWKGGISPAIKGRLYRAKYPEREKAHQAVRGAIRNGILKKQPCEICGISDSHAHHDDYEKLLDVRWLCKKHHLQEHRAG